MNGVEQFLAYLRHKVRVLSALTVAFAGVGVACVVEAHLVRALTSLSGVAFIMAAAAAYLCIDGRMTTRKVQRLARNEGHHYQLSAGPGAPPRNSSRLPSGIRAIVTGSPSCDEPKVAEMHSRWFTPGLTNQPASDATLFGSLEIGSAVLAVGERGGLLGTVTAVRARP